MDGRGGLWWDQALEGPAHSPAWDRPFENRDTGMNDNESCTVLSPCVPGPLRPQEWTDHLESVTGQVTAGLCRRKRSQEGSDSSQGLLCNRHGPHPAPQNSFCQLPPRKSQEGQGQEHVGHSSASACGQKGLDQALEHSHVPLLKLPDAP